MLIFFASQVFVHQLEVIGPWLGMPPQLVALLLSPIATELPETLNAVIWVRQQKPDLALEIVDARLASERIENPGSVLGVPRLSLVRAEALSALGRYEEAMLALVTARAEATAQGARPMLWKIEAALGHVHRAQRQRLEARRAFDAARAMAEEMAAKIKDPAAPFEIVLLGLDFDDEDVGYKEEGKNVEKVCDTIAKADND